MADTGPPAEDSTNQDALRELVAEVLDAIETDGPSALEAACTQHPEQADSLRRRIGALVAAGLVELDPARTQIIGNAQVPGSQVPGSQVPGSQVPGETLIPGRTLGNSGQPEGQQTLGSYQLLETLGVGGMGVVYRAHDPVRNESVALKVIRPELLYFPGARARFRRETSIVSRLHDPGIIAVHEVGEADGVPFLAMELVDGGTLEQVVGDRRRGTAQTSDLAGSALARSWPRTCVGWTASIARSLDHAHERGVLHRDIKPSNLMLAKDGRLLVMDFGLAAAEGTGSLTNTGTQLGSLPYMAPELLIGGARDATVRSDVYSLGVVLYELLALQAPFGAGNTDSVRDLVLAANPTPLRTHDRSIPRDLATVVARAMDRDPSRRYPTMERFAADLDNLRTGATIHARPSGTWLKLARSVRRHPTRYTAAALGVALLTAAPLMHVIGARSERDAAVWSSYRAQLSAAAVSIELGDPSEARRHLDACPVELRAWSWHYLNHRIDTSLAVLATGLPAARELICPDPRTAIGCFEDGSIRAFDIKEQSERYRLAPTKGRYVSIAQSGREFVTARIAGDQQATRVERREFLTGKLLGGFALGHSGPARLLQAPRGDRLIAIFPGQEMCQLDPTTGAELDRWRRAPGTSVAGVSSAGVAYYGPDNRLAVRLPTGKTIQLVNAARSQASIHFDSKHESTVLWAEMTNYLAQVIDGRPTLVTLDGSGLGEGRLVHRFSTLPELGRAGPVTALGADKPGLWITTGHQRGPILIWASYRAQLQRRLFGHTTPVTALAWVPGQRELVSASRGGTLRLWTRKPATERRSFRPFAGRLTRSPLERLTAIRAHAASRRVALGHADGTIEVVDGLDGCPIATLIGHTRTIADLAFSAEGLRVASVSDDQTIRVWAVDNQQLVLQIQDAAFAPTAVAIDSNRIVAADANGELRLWIDGILSAQTSLTQPVCRLWIAGRVVHGRAVDGHRFRWQGEAGVQVLTDALPKLLQSMAEADSANRVHPVFAVLEDQQRAAIAMPDGSVHVHETERGDQLLVIPAPAVSATTALEFGSAEALLRIDRGNAVETLPITRLTTDDLQLLRSRSRILLHAVHARHVHSADSWDVDVARRKLVEDIGIGEDIRTLALRLLATAGPNDLATAERARRLAVNTPRDPTEWNVALREVRRVLPKFEPCPAKRRLETTLALLLLRTGAVAAAAATVAQLEAPDESPQRKRPDSVAPLLPPDLLDPLLPLIDGLCAMAQAPTDRGRALKAREQAKTRMALPANRRMPAASILLAELEANLDR